MFFCEKNCIFVLILLALKYRITIIKILKNLKHNQTKQFSGPKPLSANAFQARQEQLKTKPINLKTLTL